MATWYAQTSAASFFAVSGGTTSSQWNSAVGGGGSFLDLSTNYTADTFNSNGKTTIGITANVTAAVLTSAGGAGTWLINTTSVTITANLVAGTSATFLMDSGTPTVNVVGSVTGGASSNDHCINLSVAGTLNVTGDVTGGTGSGAAGINVTAAATVNVTGNVLGSTASAIYTTHGSGTATVAITGNVTAAAAAAIACNAAATSALSVTSGNIVDTGTMNAYVLRNGSFVFTPGGGNYYRIRTAGSTTIDLSAGSGGGGAWMYRSIGGGV